MTAIFFFKYVLFRKQSENNFLREPILFFTAATVLGIGFMYPLKKDEKMPTAFGL
jgi:hypothetical protein